MTAIEPTVRHNLVEHTLEELATMADEELRLVEGHLSEALSHARRCGELLLAARDQMERGEFRKWVEENTSISYAKATYLQRIAFYFRCLPADEVASMGVAAAKEFLTGLPPVGSEESKYMREPEPQEKLFTRALLDDGLTHQEVAKASGVPFEVVLRWHDEKAYRRWKAERESYYASRSRREAERKQKIAKAYAVLEALELAQASSTSASKAYSQVRKLSAALHSLEGEVSDEFRRMEFEQIRGVKLQRELAQKVAAAASAARTCEARLSDALRLEHML